MAHTTTGSGFPCVLKYKVVHCFPPWSKHGTTCQGFLSCHTRTSKQGTADGGPEVSSGGPCLGSYWLIATIFDM